MLTIAVLWALSVLYVFAEASWAVEEPGQVTYVTTESSGSYGGSGSYGSSGSSGKSGSYQGSGSYGGSGSFGSTASGSGSYGTSGSGSYGSTAKTFRSPRRAWRVSSRQQYGLGWRLRVPRYRVSAGHAFMPNATMPQHWATTEDPYCPHCN